MIKNIVPFLFLFSLGSNSVFSQSYRIDSLQFKVYTIAFYKNSNLDDIKLDKVFCDYCSDNELTALGQLALKQSNKLIKIPKYRLINGEKRLAIYLRIAKEDFANIKKNDTIK